MESKKGIQHDFTAGLICLHENQSEPTKTQILSKLLVGVVRHPTIQVRTEAGTQDYLNIMSYQSTVMRHGVSVFDALTAAFAGNGAIVLQ